ncbi:MAG: lysophospholipid acyltransferase family protein [Proteobacteria bacterium]|nr:lysophospholipid acyltransferase family protein [Pseudomonadota bacterium]
MMLALRWLLRRNMLWGQVVAYQHLAMRGALEVADEFTHIGCARHNAHLNALGSCQFSGGETMGQYVVLMRDHSSALAHMQNNVEALNGIKEGLERWEAKVIASYRLLGEWDQCYFIDAPSNFLAYRATLSQEWSVTSDTLILPAVEMPLFQRLMQQEIRTAGPYKWQVQWWTRLVRMAMYDYSFGRHARKFFTSHDVFGKEHFDGIEQCIVVANHASHHDQYALMKAIPWRIRINLFFGAAADRWFLRGRKEITLQPWYASLVTGTYPIRRGGGSKTLDYPKWLLSKGANLMLFPEGTRARGRHMSHFKHGVSILALESGVTVVPVYLEGLQKIRPPGTRESVPGPVAAHVLEPISFPVGTSVPDATHQIYHAMQVKQNELLA